jgi:hypothetical protein
VDGAGVLPALSGADGGVGALAQPATRAANSHNMKPRRLCMTSTVARNEFAQRRIICLSHLLERKILAHQPLALAARRACKAASVNKATIVPAACPELLNHLA